MTIRKRTALNGDTWWHCPACGMSHPDKPEAQACCGWQGDGEDAGARQIGGDHYTTMTVQPWDVIDQWPDRAAFYRGNVLKYLMRAGTKGDALEDARKAAHYAEKWCEALEALKAEAMARGTTD